MQRLRPCWACCAWWHCWLAHAWLLQGRSVPLLCCLRETAALQLSWRPGHDWLTWKRHCEQWMLLLAVAMQQRALPRRLQQLLLAVTMVQLLLVTQVTLLQLIRPRR